MTDRSIAARALLEQAHLWSRGTRKSDGLSFLLVPGSKSGTAYYTTAEHCTCEASRRYPGPCKHSLAVRLHEEHQAAVDQSFAEVATAARARRFDALYPADDTDDAISRAVARTRAELERVAA